ncbi:hypothetical protein NL676_030409 [Syzygium grande]|nr:hypothetical protein NL676_030409 [Syzygium grande]
MKRSVKLYDFFNPGTPPKTILIGDYQQPAQSNRESRRDLHRRCASTRESKAVSSLDVSSSSSVNNSNWLSLGNRRYSSHQQSGWSSSKPHLEGKSKSKSMTKAPVRNMNVSTASSSSSVGSN